MHVIDSTFTDNQALDDCESMGERRRGTSRLQQPVRRRDYSRAASASPARPSPTTTPTAPGCDPHVEQHHGGHVDVLGNSAGCRRALLGSGGGFLAKGGADVSDSTITGNTAGCDSCCEGSGGGFLAGRRHFGRRLRRVRQQCRVRHLLRRRRRRVLRQRLRPEWPGPTRASAGVTAADRARSSSPAPRSTATPRPCDTEESTRSRPGAPRVTSRAGAGAGSSPTPPTWSRCDQSTLSGNSATCLPFV